MKIRLWSVPVLFVFVVTGAALAAEQDKKPAQPSPDEKAMMEAWMKAATPGEMHKKLDSMIGTWDAKVSSWQAPGTEPAVSTGTSESSWALGGRFVQENFTGSFMGQPFHGIGYTGYDNVKKQYISSWMDDMGTAMMISTGTVAGPNSMTFETSMADPMSGKSMPMTEKLTVADNDHHTFEMWAPAPDGKMFKMMEIEYTRRK